MTNGLKSSLRYSNFSESPPSVILHGVNSAQYHTAQGQSPLSVILRRVNH